MDPVTIAIGIGALLYGAYTLYLRRSNPGRFGKLQAMQSQWGQRAGTVIHIVAYSFVPIVFGLAAILIGISGGSLF